MLKQAEWTLRSLERYKRILAGKENGEYYTIYAGVEEDAASGEKKILAHYLYLLKGGETGRWNTQYITQSQLGEVYSIPEANDIELMHKLDDLMPKIVELVEAEIETILSNDYSASGLNNDVDDFEALDDRHSNFSLSNQDRGHLQFTVLKGQGRAQDFLAGAIGGSGQPINAVTGQRKSFGENQAPQQDPQGLIGDDRESDTNEEKREASELYSSEENFRGSNPIPRPVVARDLWNNSNQSNQAGEYFAAPTHDDEQVPASPKKNDKKTFTRLFGIVDPAEHVLIAMYVAYILGGIAIWSVMLLESKRQSAHSVVNDYNNNGGNGINSDYDKITSANNAAYKFWNDEDIAWGDHAMTTFVVTFGLSLFFWARYIQSKCFPEATGVGQVLSYIVECLGLAYFLMATNAVGFDLLYRTSLELGGNSDDAYDFAHEYFEEHNNPKSIANREAGIYRRSSNFVTEMRYIDSNYYTSFAQIYLWVPALIVAVSTLAAYHNWDKVRGCCNPLSLCSAVLVSCFGVCPSLPCFGGSKGKNTVRNNDAVEPLLGQFGGTIGNNNGEGLPHDYTALRSSDDEEGVNHLGQPIVHLAENPSSLHGSRSASLDVDDENEALDNLGPRARN